MGNQHVGKQNLSIGHNCDRTATVQHEFLHALGFFHEQSRSDRDDYVSIIWDRITPGTFLYFFLFMAALVSYGGSQARGPIRATGASLLHSHSNARSESHLPPTPQLMATLDL